MGGLLRAKPRRDRSSIREGAGARVMTAESAKTGRERSGLIDWVDRPKRHAVTGSEVREALNDLTANMSLEGRLTRARRETERAEKLALSIYAKHGLPSVNGAYSRRDGEDWKPQSLATEPGGKWERVPGAKPELGAQCCHLEKVPEVDFPLDAEARRAAEILSAAGDAFRILKQAEKQGSWHTVQAFLVGMRLSAAAHIWREEWVLNDYIVPARLTKDGGSLGGVKGGMTRRQNAKVWQAHALELALERRAANPSLSQTNLAADVQAYWRRDTKAPGVDSIVRFIRRAEDDGKLPRSRRNKRGSL
jgi:hypothetical protein